VDPAVELSTVTGVYRFLLTPRWLGYLALTLVGAAVMVGLGFWQLDRFHERNAINQRIEAGASGPSVVLGERIGAPTGGAGTAGPAPARDAEYTRVSATGRFDRSREILIRDRTVNDTVGFEVLTPLVLDDGTAVLVDRGWVAPANGGAAIPPEVPPAPAGEVTAVGRLRAPESRASRPTLIAGHLQTRRISPASIAPALPYALYDAYISENTVAAGMVAVAPQDENALMNGGYTIEWWLFAAGLVAGYGFVARKEARDTQDRAEGRTSADDDIDAWLARYEPSES
jgi:cytochrome oxidase assembly protein ShyY1